jgi:hypothetical protein
MVYVRSHLAELQYQARREDRLQPLFQAVAARLVDLFKTCRARYGALLYTTSVLAREVERLDPTISKAEIDALLEEQLFFDIAAEAGAVLMVLDTEQQLTGQPLAPSQFG